MTPVDAGVAAVGLVIVAFEGDGAFMMVRFESDGGGTSGELLFAVAGSAKGAGAGAGAGTGTGGGRRGWGRAARGVAQGVRGCIGRVCVYREGRVYRRKG